METILVKILATDCPPAAAPARRALLFLTELERQ